MENLKGKVLPNVRGADVRGVAKVGRLPDHVPADLGTLPDNVDRVSKDLLWLNGYEMIG